MHKHPAVLHGKRHERGHRGEAKRANVLDTPSVLSCCQQDNPSGHVVPSIQ